jgi:type II secretory pathway pseudopilin PulG
MKTKVNNRGFTLVETLIAITILILAVTGAFAAAQNGISSAIFSKDQIVAFYLAQEGIEHVRNLRDQNGLEGNGRWLKGFGEVGDPCQLNPVVGQPGNRCRVDAVANTIAQCIGECPNIKFNDFGFYAYDSGADSKFKREITLTNVVDGKEVAIIVRVTWSKGLVNREFVARENIFNWQ